MIARTRASAPLLVALVAIAGCGAVHSTALCTYDAGACARLAAATHDSANAWKRVDASTVRIDGNIDKESEKAFARVFDAEVRRVELNSGGGDVLAALRIASQIRDAGLEVVVDGYCLSSCANYLFTSGSKRTLRGGLVGFHGNIGECARREGGAEAWARKWAPRDASQSELAAESARYQSLITAEQSYLAATSIDSALFFDSCAPDKGMNDGITYSFLLPSADTFARYGFGQIDGTQDTLLLKAYNQTFHDTPAVLR